MIYHVTTTREWDVFKDKQVYAAASFQQEKFIHTCHLSQVQGVLERYYMMSTDLILLHIQERKLTSPLKHEPGTNGELFPHIYGEINKEAIERIDFGRENFLKY
jgi:uncharacterized protein (DUF952 family)